jgi:hypothetical protein
MEGTDEGSVEQLAAPIKSVEDKWRLLPSFLKVWLRTPWGPSLMQPRRAVPLPARCVPTDIPRPTAARRCGVWCGNTSSRTTTSSTPTSEI